jgi:hypothetical protein
VITHVNPAFLRMWGYVTKEQAIGNSVGSFFADPDDAKPVRGQVSGEYSVTSSWGNGGGSVTAHSHLEFVKCSYYDHRSASIKKRT